MKLDKLTDEALLEQCPDAWMTDRIRRCGEGLNQPQWGACPADGIWGLYGFLNQYCTYHAARRIRSRAQLHPKWGAR